MELFRLWGLEPAARAAAEKLNEALDVVWASTLVAPEVRRMPYGGACKQIPYIKVGHFVRFDPNEINEWLDCQRVAGGAGVSARRTHVLVGPDRRDRRRRAG